VCSIEAFTFMELSKYSGRDRREINIMRMKGKERKKE
jgi:hypothetical protein